jgi:hypothetical protein
MPEPDLDRLDTDCDTARLLREIARLRVENLLLTRERDEARREAAHWANMPTTAPDPREDTGCDGCSFRTPDLVCVGGGMLCEYCRD